MSHVISGEVAIKDIAALERAVTAMGCRFVQKKTYNWYGKSVGDTPLPKGRTAAQLGTCDYCIQVPGITYEVGVVRQKDGSFSLEYDFFGLGKEKGGQAYRHEGIKGGYHDGALLKEKFGDKLSKLQQLYNKQVVVAKAKAAGYFVREKITATGAIKLQFVRA